MISSRTSGASALIEEGGNRFIHSFRPGRTVSTAADRVLGDESLASALGAAGHDRAAREYDTEALAGRMIRLYADLVEEKRALRHPT